MKPVTAFFILWLFAYCSQAQYIISGHVLESESKLPIASASIFIVNTTTGTSTDINGHFLLQVPSPKVDLVITHLAYLPRVITAKGGQRDLEIVLEKSTVELDQVAVESKADKQWKKRFKTFQKKLLGETQNAKKCEFKNPWVVDIHSGDDGFKATTDNAIQVCNYGLGYDINIYLEKFTLKNTQVSYQLKPIFQNIKSEDEYEVSKWEDNRKRAFLGSQRHFMLALSQGQLKENGFRIFEAKYDPRINRFDQIRRLQEKDILHKGMLDFRGYLKVVYEDERPDRSYISNELDTYAQISYLKLRYSGIEITEYGLLKQPEGLAEYGYWGWEGIAELLPFDYLPEEFLASTDAKPFDQNLPTKNGFLLTKLQIPFDEIMTGGPNKNGIPALHYPKFIPTSDAHYLADDDQVLGITIDGQSKAYPIKIMDWHEIVNDRIGKKNFLMTYCPLCGSGVAFDAYMDGKPLVFQVSGLLYNSDVLLYDLQTESLWSQIMSQAVAGDYAGQSLEILPTIQTTWKDWKKIYPDGLVLSDKTGHQRDYQSNAYEGYRKSDQLMFPVNKDSNALSRKEYVYGIEVGGRYKAYPIVELNKSDKTFTDVVANETLYFKYDSENEKIGVIDSQGHPLPATKLYWFAWYAFHPDTEVYRFQ